MIFKKIDNMRDVEAICHYLGKSKDHRWQDLRCSGLRDYRSHPSMRTDFREQSLEESLSYDSKVALREDYQPLRDARPNDLDP